MVVFNTSTSYFHPKKSLFKKLFHDKIDFRGKYNKKKIKANFIHIIITTFDNLYLKNLTKLEKYIYEN
jgi:hypothetical protein